jgi:hypothetical protein
MRKLAHHTIDVIVRVVIIVLFLLIAVGAEMFFTHFPSRRTALVTCALPEY